MHTATKKPNKGVTVISAEIKINAPKEKVWAVLSDIGAIQNFHPLVKASKTTSYANGSVGAQRKCELLPMGVMEEKVVEWHEGHELVMEVVGGKMLPPYRLMRGAIELKTTGTMTQARFTFSYQLKFGILGQLMNLALIKPQFKKGPPQYVKGLKEYVENLDQH